MYVFTSEKDPVLGYLVPIAGTADRESGAVASAGLRGFRTPRSALPETRCQYAKVVTIPWRPEFAQFGYTGRHTDVLNRRFVAAYIAPRIVKQVGAAPAALASRAGKVRNPDYERWAKFGIGSYSVAQGHQEYQGRRTAVRLRVTLKSKSPGRLLVEREFYLADRDAALPAQVHSLIAEAWIDPEYDPITSPSSKIEPLPSKLVTVKGQTFSCPGLSIDADGSYPDWGSDLTAMAYRCPDVPGGLVETELLSHFEGEPFRFEGRVVDFKIVPDPAGR
jgi:hypothetical protein